MAIKLGSTDISDIRLGDKQVSAVYLGDKLVWEKGGQPDIELKQSFSNSVFIQVWDDTSVFYTVKNVGTSSIGAATVTLTTNVNTTTGTFSIVNLPAGWSLISNTGNTYVLKNTKVLNPGDTDVLHFNYYTDTDNPPYITFSGQISPLPGEQNTANNSTSKVLPVIT